MALLYRFTKLNDRHNTGIFTFIVTRSVTRDLHRDATTKDFYYGYLLAPQLCTTNSS